jgi:hypothetical protein
LTSNTASKVYITASQTSSAHASPDFEASFPRLISIQSKLSNLLRVTIATRENMPLTKKPPSKKRGPAQKPSPKDEQKGNGFSQARLDRICNSMQPLMTKHTSEEELEGIFRNAEGFVEDKKKKGGLWWLKRLCLARVGGR